MNVALSRIVFPAQDQVAYEEIADHSVDMKADDVLIQTEYSVISAGTELAKLTGLQTVSYPFVPGNRAVGRVVGIGSGVSDLRIGDRIFSHSLHMSHALANRLRLPVPDDVDPCTASLVGMAMVAMTAVRVGQVELGDRVAVIGMGLVGNLAAQLLQLAGAEVTAIDLVAGRLAKAQASGIQHVIDGSRQNVVETLMDATQGQGVDVVVEASGAPQAAELAAALTGKKGEGVVVLLGSPRRSHTTDLTPLLNQVHLWRNGCVTFRGAHEWRYPLAQQPFQKHSMQRNGEAIFRLMAQGRLHTAPLITQCYRPQDAAQAYAVLQQAPDDSMGVVFDWTQEASS